MMEFESTLEEDLNKEFNSEFEREFAGIAMDLCTPKPNTILKINSRHRHISTFNSI
jgi:hypothetical protein